MSARTGVLGLVLSLSFASGLTAAEITPLVTFHQDLSIGTAFESEAKIDASAGLGLMLSFERRDDLRLDLLYVGQRSEMSVEDPEQTPIEFPIDIEVHYFQIGGRRYFRTDGAARPYLGGALGGGILRPDFSDASLRFSLSFGGGVDIPIAGVLALRLDARWYGLLFGEDVAVACGAGCDGSLDAGAVNQFVIAAGLAIRVGR